VAIVIASAVALAVALWALRSLTDAKRTRETPATFRM